MKRQKRWLTGLLTLMITILTCVGTIMPVKAEDGWLSCVRDAELDTTYSEVLSLDDYTNVVGAGTIWVKTLLYHVFEFEMPAKGEITVYIESDYKDFFSDIYSEKIFYDLYKKEDPDKKIWNENGVGNYQFSEARNKYYGSFTISLSKGSYYFVLRGASRLADEDYTISFNYLPLLPVPYVTSMKAKKAGLKATWNKVSEADGYQMAVSTNAKFSSSKTKTYKLTSKTKVAKTITNLKNRKTYYVRVRSYKKVKVNDETKTYWSDWSDWWSVKTK